MKSKFFTILLIFCVAASCNRSSEPLATKTISVSILPQKYFVESIAGKNVKVNVMIPPGASHSSYEPTARQMNSLVQSQAYFRIGHLDFEMAWIQRFEGVNSSMKIFDLSKGIEFIKGSENKHPDNRQLPATDEEKGIDPHIWMSPSCVRIIASNILKSLVTLYPSDSLEFMTNYQTFIGQIDEVDSLYKMNAGKLQGRSFIIYHPALAYLARDYGMKQIVLEFDGKEPPPAHIKAIIDLAREKNIHSVFVQKQFSIDNSRSLAKEIKAEIIRIDPFDENWKEQMISILNHLIAN